MTTILHFADLHLDASFAGSHLTCPTGLPRQRLREALRRVVDVALERGVDAVTVGGDLYEHDRCTRDTAAFVRQQFGRLAPTPVFIAPGNHDPYLPDSCYRQEGWPANVYIFGEERLAPRQLPGGVTLWGLGHRSNGMFAQPLDGWRAPDGGTHVLLMHGTDRSSVPPGKSQHCPFTPDQVASAGLRTALLGHFHAASPLTPGGKLFYPGSTEPLGFDEPGAHQALLFRLEGSSLQVQPVPTGQMRFVSLGLDVSSFGSRDQVRQAIREESERQGLAGACLLLRLRLTGLQSPGIDLDLADLADLAGSLAGSCASLDLVDETSPPYDYESLAGETSTRGAFVKKMLLRLQQAGDADRDTLKQALVLGLRAFDGEELRAR